MATLVVDDLGRPVPQFENRDSGTYEGALGVDGSMYMMQYKPNGYVVDTQGGAVNVGTSATELKGGASRLTARREIVAYNISDATVYLGKSGVTTASGLPLPPNTGISIPLDPDNDLPWYAITATGSKEVRVLETK